MCVPRWSFCFARAIVDRIASEASLLATAAASARFCSPPRESRRTERPPLPPAPLLPVPVAAAAAGRGASSAPLCAAGAAASAGAIDPAAVATWCAEEWGAAAAGFWAGAAGADCRGLVGALPRGDVGGCCHAPPTEAVGTKCSARADDERRRDELRAEEPRGVPTVAEGAAPAPVPPRGVPFDGCVAPPPFAMVRGGCSAAWPPPPPPVGWAGSNVSAGGAEGLESSAAYRVWQRCERGWWGRLTAVVVEENAWAEWMAAEADLEEAAWRWAELRGIFCPSSVSSAGSVEPIDAR